MWVSSLTADIFYDAIVKDAEPEVLEQEISLSKYGPEGGFREV